MCVVCFLFANMILFKYDSARLDVVRHMQRLHIPVMHQERDTEAAKWNSAIIHFIAYTCTSPTVTCQKSLYCASLTGSHVQAVFEHAPRDFTAVSTE